MEHHEGIVEESVPTAALSGTRNITLPVNSAAAMQRLTTRWADCSAGLSYYTYYPKEWLLKKWPTT